MMTIEHEPIVLLEAGGVALRLADCRVLHPHKACQGRGCWGCNRTGIGPIEGHCLTYCENCSKSNRDFDPRLRLLPGDTPRPDPPAPIEVPDDLLGKRGGLRTMTAVERRKEESRINREARAEKKRRAAKTKADAKKAKAKLKANPVAKEQPKPQYIAVRKTRKQVPPS